MNVSASRHRIAGQVRRARRQFPFAARSMRTVLPLARAHYGCSYSSLAMRAMLLLRQRFLPEEAFQLGLFDPSLEAAAVASYLSKSSLKQIQNNLNPLPWDRLVEDKGVFYRLCHSFDLPSPDLYAVVYRNRPGWVAGKSPPRTRAEWEKFVESELPREFIVKPTFGVYGRGVSAYTRRDGGFESSIGDHLDARALLQSLWSDPTDRGFIIQERLRCHPDIARLSVTDALQTARVDVISTREGPHILGAGLKFIRSNHIIDNLDHGATGNFIMRIGVQDGILLDGRGMERGRPGFRTITHHPVTGHLLTGTRIPLWDEVREIVSRAMRTFQPLKAVGWDVGITPQGVRLIEGNAWFDPALNLQGRVRRTDRASDTTEYLSRLYSFTSNGSGDLKSPPANA